MKKTLLTLSMTAAVASAVLVFATPQPGMPATAATPQPTTPSTKSKKDVCASTKSKWAHLQCEQFNASAPGDEYFGRMKMSYLGIDNTYKDGAISAGDFTTDPHLIAKLDFATEALRRWASKYPNDPELARSYFLAVAVLRKVYTQPEQQVTWEFIQLLVTKYKNTYFGKYWVTALKNEGYTEHWMGVAQICPTAAPAAVGDPPPAPTASPAPDPRHPMVAVIEPPCVQPSTADVDPPAPQASKKP